MGSFFQAATLLLFCCCICSFPVLTWLPPPFPAGNFFPGFDALIQVICVVFATTPVTHPIQHPNKDLKHCRKGCFVFSLRPLVFFFFYCFLCLGVFFLTVTPTALRHNFFRGHPPPLHWLVAKVFYSSSQDPPTFVPWFLMPPPSSQMIRVFPVTITLFPFLQANLFQHRVPPFFSFPTPGVFWAAESAFRPLPPAPPFTVLDSIISLILAFFFWFAKPLVPPFSVLPHLPSVVLHLFTLFTRVRDLKTVFMFFFLTLSQVFLPETPPGYSKYEILPLFPIRWIFCFFCTRLFFGRGPVVFLFVFFFREPHTLSPVTPVVFSCFWDWSFQPLPVLLFFPPNRGSHSLAHLVPPSIFLMSILPQPLVLVDISIPFRLRLNHVSFWFRVLHLPQAFLPPVGMSVTVPVLFLFVHSLILT